MFISLKNAVICVYLAAFFFHFSTHIQLLKLIINIQFYFGLNDDGGGGSGGGGGDYDNDDDDYY